MTAGAQGPAKRKRTKGGRYSHEITKEEIELYYHLPCEEASRQLGIGLTILKRICRRLGIEKWPYRQLKRAGKLGEAAAIGAANAGADSPLPSQGGVAKSPAGAPKPPAARKRVPPRKKPSVWEPNDQSTTQEEEEDEEEGEDEEGDEGSPARAAGSTGGSGSEGSWQAARHGAPTPAGGPDLQPAAWLPAAGIARQVSEPLAPGVPIPHPAAGGRRRGAPAADLHRRPGRVSIDLGVMAHAGGVFCGGHASASPQLSGSVGNAACRGAAASRSMPQQQACGALKRRAREEEFDPLVCLMDNTSDAAQISPFTAAAQVLPEGAWTPGSDGGGAWQGAQDPGAEQLAQGLSRLAMRTLSLKRQCSRGGEALDPLEAALLMERLEAQAPLVNPARSCSMPLGPKHSSPPVPRGAQKGWLPSHVGAGTLARQGGWLSAEQLRQQGGLESIDEPDEEGLLPLGDPNLSNLRCGASLHTIHALSSSDLVSEGCLLQEATTFAPLASLHHGGSSGVLVECGPDSRRHDAAAAERAQHGRHAGSGSALAQAGAGAHNTALPLELAHAADLYGLAAGVTAVGLASAAEALQDDTLYPELPSPFSIGSGPEQDREVDDLLVDFLSPAPSQLAEARMAELLGAFSPRPSPRLAGMDDPVLTGSARTPRAPALAAGVPSGPGGAGTAALRPGDAAALAGPHSGHCAPSSSGMGALPTQGAAALDVPPGVHLAQDPDRLKQAVAGHWMPAQAQHLQQAQHPEAAARAGAPSAGSLLPPGSQELEQAVEQHQAMAQRYLHLRSEVQAMLSQRGSSQQLGALAGDQEHLQQLARLKQLKQQLAAALARQLVLQQQHACAAAAAMAPTAQPVAVSQQPKALPFNPFAVQPSLVSDISSAFSGGLAPRLGPPPPLPGTCGAKPVPARAQEHGSGMLSVTAMLQQWRADAERAAAAPGFEPVLQAQVQQRTVRASSAPLPWDLGWAATA